MYEVDVLGVFGYSTEHGTKNPSQTNVAPWWKGGIGWDGWGDVYKHLTVLKTTCSYWDDLDVSNKSRSHNSDHLIEY